jgi:hypothetical protein
MNSPARICGAALNKLVGYASSFRQTLKGEKLD